MSASTLRNKIGILLLDEPLSLKEVAAILEIKEKKAYSLLKNMFQNDRVIGFKAADGQRKYRATEKEIEAATKRKIRAEKKAAKEAAKKASE
jgi:predicted ArsR family transcriptional regulator